MKNIIKCCTNISFIVAATISIAQAQPATQAASFLNATTVKTADALVGANWAWARGYTGVGSTILIMDSGISVNNSAFAGRIVQTIDFTGTGIQDTNGHGTNVAGIAAASSNGITGTTGIAPGATLAIAKITTGTGVNFQSAQKALLWAGQNPNIVVANLSANTVYSASYLAASKQVAPGLYINTDKNYGGAQYYNQESPTAWKIPGQMVLVVSAGNQNTGYVQNPATFATATNAAGQLLLGGQMLIVGDWNPTLNKQDGALAGTMCKNFNTATNTCQDLYKTSDFYIMAPGTAITSTGIANGTTSTMSGTSQAAPAVAGAVAIIHQMWPYMTGANIEQLLLKTANKNLPGYDVNTMGQGLLDLNRATQPIGTLGISTTGRTGTATPLTGALSLTGGSLSGSLSSISVVDGMQRDYTVNMSSMAIKNNLLADPTTLDVTPGYNWSSRWTGAPTTYLPGVSGGSAGNNSTVTFDSSYINPTSSIKQLVTLTQSDYNPYVAFSGVWGQTKSSTTYEYSGTYKPSPQGLWAQAGIMQTVTQFVPGMVQSISPIYAVHASGGYQLGDWNMFGGIKPTVVSGNVTVTLPNAVDINGNMQYNTVRANLAGDSPIGYVGAQYQHNFKDGQVYGARLMLAQDSSYMAKLYYMYRF
jgi:subtilisin family serine protease